MRHCLLLLCLLALLAPAPGWADSHDDDDSAGDDDDSGEEAPDDAATYGWICGVGPVGAPAAPPIVLLLCCGLLGRRISRRPRSGPTGSGGYSQRAFGSSQ